MHPNKRPPGHHRVRAHRPVRPTEGSRAPPASSTTAPIPSYAVSKVKKALANSLAPSTARKYKYSVAAYLKFCDALRTPPNHRLPASEDLLCAFAASRIGQVSESTVRNALSAVKALHIRGGVVWNGGPRLELVIRGVANCAPTWSSLPERPGVTAEMLGILPIHLDLQDPKDATILAVANTAFWALARLGELLPESESASLDHLPKRADLRPVSQSGLSRSIHLPYTKVKRGKGEEVFLTNQSGLANPLPILENHLLVNQPSSGDTLFSFKGDQGGPRRILTKRAFLQRCNQVWSAQGQPQVKGHSFRIGGTTELLRAGVAPDVVKKMGRWSSDHFLRYWRSTQIVGERHVANVSAPMHR